MSKVPKKIPHLVLKGARFYFRIRVPDELQAHVGKKEISQGLGDVNSAQAAVRVAQLAAEWKTRFLNDSHALGLAPSPAVAHTTPIQALNYRPATLQEVKAVAVVASRTLLQLDEEARIEGWERMDTPEAFGPGRPMEEATRAVISGRRVDALQMQAEDHLAAHGLMLPDDPLDRRRALYAWATATASATKGRKLRDDGEVVETPPAVALPASLVAPIHASLRPAEKPAKALKMRDVFELWEAYDQKSAKGVKDYARALGYFERLTSNPAVGLLTPADGMSFRAALMTCGELTPHAARKMLEAVSTLVNFEVRRYKRVSVNHLRGLTIDVPPTEKRRPWTDEEVCTLFSTPLFQAYELPKARNASKDAAYWVPVLVAYSGARVTEMAQLLTSDVFEKTYRTGEGEDRRDVTLWCVRLQESSDEQSIKNRDSWRTIPLHSELVRLGFPDYVAMRAKSGAARLFPDATVTEQNNAGGGLTTWGSAYKRALGFGPTKVFFHSFRHAVETKLRRAREPASHINELTGHSHKDGGEGQDSYMHLEPPDLLETVEKIRYAGLQLPRVWPRRE